MRIRYFLAITALPCALAAQTREPPPDVLPPLGTTQLARSFEAAAAHARHVWRDTPPTNADGSVNAYVEISRGDRRKWEFDMRANARAIDRVMPEDVGGYPVNYGFVPQTLSYDGDPLDVLVLGPPLPGGDSVRGVIVGLMYMEDEKGPDSKVVLSAAGRNGRPVHELQPDDRRLIGDFFNRYKQHEPGKFSKVPGWGSAAQALAYVTTTHAFFVECRDRAGVACRIARPSSIHGRAGTAPRTRRAKV